MNEIKLEAIEDIILYSNNKISIVLIKNAESQYWIKHIDI